MSANSIYKTVSASTGTNQILAHSVILGFCNNYHDELLTIEHLMHHTLYKYNK